MQTNRGRKLVLMAQAIMKRENVTSTHEIISGNHAHEPTAHTSVYDYPTESPSSTIISDSGEDSNNKAINDETSTYSISTVYGDLQEAYLTNESNFHHKMDSVPLGPVGTSESAVSEKMEWDETDTHNTSLGRAIREAINHNIIYLDSSTVSASDKTSNILKDIPYTNGIQDVQLTESNFSQNNGRPVDSVDIYAESPKFQLMECEKNDTLLCTIPKTLEHDTIHSDRSTSPVSLSNNDKNYVPSNSSSEESENNVEYFSNEHELQDLQPVPFTPVLDGQKKKRTDSKRSDSPNDTIHSDRSTSPVSLSNDDKDYVPSNSSSEESENNVEYFSDEHELQDLQPVPFTPVLDGQKKKPTDSKRSDPPKRTKICDIYEKQSLKKKKRTRCLFCKDYVTNFERHLVRKHKEEKEVKELMQFPIKSEKRREIIALLRKDGHFQEFMKGNVIPAYRSARNKCTQNYVPCGYCKGIFFKPYLARHSRKCKAKCAKEKGARPASASQTLIACASEFGDTLLKMRIRSEVLSIMQADAISLTAKTDTLILQFGEHYLKKHKRPQMANSCSNKIRELARLLIDFREKTGKIDCSLSDMLNPVVFDQVINSAKNIGGYDEEKKTFKAPSLSTHIGTSMKQVSEICIKLLLQQSKLIKCENTELKIVEVKRFKKLVESQWTTEISSIAIKDLNEKKWQKKTILPLTKDVLTFKEFALQLATKNKLLLEGNPNNSTALKTLTQCALAITILFNRRRIGDVQYLKISEYSNNVSSSNIDEFQLSESEKVLTMQYKRVVTAGKGSRKIVILFPPVVQDLIDVILSTRNRSNIVPSSNDYLFALPGKEKWVRGDTAIRQIAQKCGIKPEGFSSNKLRKQIATVMQLLNLNKEETQQFAQFMGHTEKTHNEFYVLPQDLYQTAKVSKLLIMIDRGEGKEYLGKTLNDIHIDPATEYAESEGENSDEDNKVTGSAPPNPLNTASDTEDSDSTNMQSSSTKNIKQKQRATWSKKEKEVVINYFTRHIAKKIPPKKIETNAFKDKFPHLFKDKDWVKIKTFVYNQYRNK